MIQPDSLINPREEPVTVVVAQRVKPGLEADYERWISHITQAAIAYPGHLGTNIIRPQLGVRPEYVTVFRFDRYENLKTWMTSRDRQYWLDQVQPLIAADAEIKQISGIEAWFSIPGKALTTPPRYKTTLLTGGVVYIVIGLLNQYVSPLIQTLPAWLQSLIICALMSGLLTYVLMPQVNRLFSPWLYRPSSPPSRNRKSH